MRHILFVICLCVMYGLQAAAQSFDIQYTKNPDGTVSRGRMENGQKTGLWITYDSQSNPKRFEEFKDGQKHGYFVENDEHGHPFMEGWFNMGKPVGKHIIFSHGTLLKEMDFDLGTIKEYYENGTLKRDGKLKEGGVPDGKMTLYYENGKVLSENNYVNGKKSGVQKYYYQSGLLQAEYHTLDDTLNGPYKDYHENGKLATEGTYEKNLKQDTWKEYDEAGKLMKQRKYKNDTEVK